jgi:hypothetical protein
LQSLRLGFGSSFSSILAFCGQATKGKARLRLARKTKAKPNLVLPPLRGFCSLRSQKKQGIASAKIAKIGMGKVLFLLLLGLGCLLLLGFFLFFC